MSNLSIQQYSWAIKFEKRYHTQHQKKIMSDLIEAGDVKKSECKSAYHFRVQ